MLLYPIFFPLQREILKFFGIFSKFFQLAYRIPARFSRSPSRIRQIQAAAAFQMSFPRQVPPREAPLNIPAGYPPGTPQNPGTAMRKTSPEQTEGPTGSSIWGAGGEEIRTRSPGPPPAGRQWQTAGPPEPELSPEQAAPQAAGRLVLLIHKGRHIPIHRYLSPI